MKKVFYFMTAFAVMAMMTTGCSDKKPQEFASKVSDYVKANQLDSLAAVYPAANFDSIAFAGDYEMVNIEKTDVDGVLRARFGDVAYIDIQEDENGNLKIIESVGIAAFPKDRLDLAKKTGMVKDSISDAEIAGLLADAEFFSWLADRQSEALNNLVSLKGSKASLIGYGMSEGDYNYAMTVELTNNSNTDINASDYDISYSYVTGGTDWNSMYNNTGKQAGEGLKVGETKKIIVKKNHVQGLKNPRISWNLSPEELGKFLTFTGNEYSEYLNSKGQPMPE